LPELLEAGGAYRDLTKGRLMVVVEKLQPQVEQLASVLSLELAGDQNYVEVLTSAHEQMASLTEQLAGQLRQHRSEDEVYTELLHEAQELTFAMQSFLEGKDQCEATAGNDRQWNNWHAPHERTQGERTAAETGSDNAVGIVALLKHLSAAVPLCRARRQELSLLLMESNSANVLAATDDDATSHLRRALEQSCRARGNTGIDVLSITAVQLAAILPNCERRGAVSIANEVLAQLADLAEREDSTPAIHTATLSAGVATVTAVPKNFDPWRLVESAERCLYAARSCNTNAVKSIEI